MARKKKNQTRIIKEEEIERMIKCQAGDRYETRNIALILCGFTMGFRATELAKLCIDNFFDENWKLKEKPWINAEQTKGGYGEGRVFLESERTKRYLVKYIEERRRAAENADKITLNDPLFVSQKGGRFKKNSLVKLIKRIFLQAGVMNDGKRAASSHSMRRTFATRLRDKGADAKTIMVALRHATPSMALEYVEADETRIENFVRLSAFK